MRRCAAGAAFLLFFYLPGTTQPYTLSLHDALPISARHRGTARPAWCRTARGRTAQRRGDVLVGLPIAVGHRPGDVPGEGRSEEHTSELQSQFHLVCRLLLEKKKNRVL